MHGVNNIISCSGIAAANKKRQIRVKINKVILISIRIDEYHFLCYAPKGVLQMKRICYGTA